MNSSILTSMFTAPVSAVFLEGMQEILGAPNTRCLLENALHYQAGKDPFAACPNGISAQDLAALQQALKGMYGERGGQGVTVRCGRAAFKYALQRFGAAAGLTSLQFRLLPVRERIRSGLEVLARLVSDPAACSMQVQDDGTVWKWQIQPGAAPLDPQAARAQALLMVGLLQGFLAWVSGGKNYNIRLLENDKTPFIQIAKQPLD